MKIKNIKTKKRAVSTVIATVLLILISIVAVSIIAAIIIPFVKKSIGPSSSCIDLMGKVRINAESGYTCMKRNLIWNYTNSTDNTKYNLTFNSVMVNIEIGDVDVEKIIVSLTKGASTWAFTLEDGVSNAAFKMYENKDTACLDSYTDCKVYLPPKNGARTYIFRSAAEIVKITPVIKGKTCDVVDIASLTNC